MLATVTSHIANRTGHAASGLAVAFAAALAASCAMADSVAKIGTTEYETLQEAFDAATGRKCTVTLLSDIDVTQQLNFPKCGSSSKDITLDGDGHTIRQAAATRIFCATSAYTYVTFKDVTILGGGETYSTADDTSIGIGTVFRAGVGTSSIKVTLDAGTVVSNFYMAANLFNMAQGSVTMNEGAIVTCNVGQRTVIGTTVYGGMFGFTTGTMTMNGGEISYNTGSYGVAVLLNNTGRFTMNGGVIKGNKTLSTVQNGGVINLYQNASTFTMNGGLITENTCINATAGYDLIDINKMKNPGVIINSGSAQFNFKGGRIVGNDGIGVMLSDGTKPINVSGDGIIMGGSLCPAVVRRLDTDPAIALVGDFTGYVEAYIAGRSTYTSQDGNWIVATNAADYAGAENIHAHGYTSRIGVQEEGTQDIWFRTPNQAKIGEREYATLDDAMAGATSGAKIELLRDVVRDAKSTWPTPPAKTLTIDGCGHKLYRAAGTNLLVFATAGADLTLTNVVLWGGHSTCYNVYTNGDMRGSAAMLLDGVNATLTLAGDVTFEDFDGANALFAVGEGGTLNLFGTAITNMTNKAVDATGGTVGLKGETFVYGNEGGDVDVANGGILSLCGDLLGKVHVTVAGAEASEGQRFGTTTGAWSGLDNFVNGGEDRKLVVSGNGGKLTWCRRGFMMLVQ